MHLLYAKTDGAITANVKEKQGNNNDNKGAVNRYMRLHSNGSYSHSESARHQLYYMLCFPRRNQCRGDKGAPRKTV